MPGGDGADVDAGLFVLVCLLARLPNRKYLSVGYRCNAFEWYFTENLLKAVSPVRFYWIWLWFGRWQGANSFLANEFFKRIALCFVSFSLFPFRHISVWKNLKILPSASYWFWWYRWMRLLRTHEGAIVSFFGRQFRGKSFVAYRFRGNPLEIALLINSGASQNRTNIK